MEIKRPLTPPGDILYDMFIDGHCTLEELAEMSGINKQTILDVIYKSQPITEEIAEGLGRAFGNTKQFWLNLQHNYDEHKRLYPQYYKEAL